MDCIALYHSETPFNTRRHPLILENTLYHSKTHFNTWKRTLTLRLAPEHPDSHSHDPQTTQNTLHTVRKTSFSRRIFKYYLQLMKLPLGNALQHSRTHFKTRKHPSTLEHALRHSDPCGTPFQWTSGPADLHDKRRKRHPGQQADTRSHRECKTALAQPWGVAAGSKFGRMLQLLHTWNCTTS